MPCSDDPSFAIPDTVLVREVGDELVMLDLRSERYFGLNGVAADIVARLTTAPHCVALAGLSEDYDVDLDVLQHDTDRLVEELLAAGLLTRRSTVSCT